MCKFHIFEERTQVSALERVATSIYTYTKKIKFNSSKRWHIQV